MSDSDKSKEQLIEELKALREQNEAAHSGESGITRREVLSGWVAPVILTVPLVPRSSKAAAEGGGNNTGADFTAFPTQLDIQAEDPAVSTSLATPSTFEPTISFTEVTAQSVPPTLFTPSTNPPTDATTFPPTITTYAPTSSPTVVIPVELSEFEVNG